LSPGTAAPRIGNGKTKSLKLKLPDKASGSRARIRLAAQALKEICSQCGEIPAFALEPVEKTAQELGKITQYGLRAAVTQKAGIVIIHADRKRTFGKRYTLESDPDGSKMSITVAALDRFHDLFIDIGRNGSVLASYRGSEDGEKRGIVEVQVSIIPSTERESDYTYYCASSKDLKKGKAAVGKKLGRLSPEPLAAIDGEIRKVAAREFARMFGARLLKTSVAERRDARDLKDISNSYRKLAPYINSRLSYAQGVKSGDLHHVSNKLLLAKLFKERRLPRVAIVRVSDRVGNGLAAGEYIPAGTIIGEYGGEIVKVTPAMPRGRDNTYFAPYAPDAVPGSEMFVIDAKRAGNPTRFINHSEANPNAAWAPVFDGKKFRLIIAATRPIPKGKQILLKYRQSYWADSADPLPLE
jgi:hypothetical protein